eukprot:TRINITY_DN4356_c0_g1_i1.p1 TRINITY_DN4356_c0_g1~~TRINITY_DN4356_c0_g1_i1.p1  ORF type:complete len:211 (-),score=60.89 TRINITY_DN4356_c0_g1_i1:189-821(-)
MEGSVNNAQAEYALRHFRSCPKTFIDNLNYSILESVSSVVDLGTRSLLKGVNDSEKETLIQKSMKKNRENWLHIADASLQKFNEVLLRDVLVVPPGMVVPEDEVHVGKDLGKEKENLKVLRAIYEDKIIEMRKMMAFKRILSRKVKELSSLDEEYSRLIQEWESQEPVEYLDLEAKMKNLIETTSFSLGGEKEDGSMVESINLRARLSGT